MVEKVGIEEREIEECEECPNGVPGCEGECHGCECDAAERYCEAAVSRPYLY